MSNYFKITIRVVSLGILALLTSLSWADLTAKVDRSVLDSNETLRLEIRYDGQVFTGEPDFKPLSNDFDVLSNNGKWQQYYNQYFADRTTTYEYCRSIIHADIHTETTTSTHFTILILAGRDCCC